jgi:acylphosphatase
MPAMGMSRVQVLFKGHVQGVGFRYTCRSLAKGFSVTGYVRNLRDGRVELVAEGDSPELDAFLEAIAASELSAFVRERAVMRCPATGEWRDFHIRHDD